MERISRENRDRRVTPRAPRAHWRLAGLVGVLLGLGAADHAPAAANPMPTVFGPGEVILFDVSYGPVSTGAARIAVGGDTDVRGRTVWPIIVQARTNDTFSKVYEIRDRFVTLWDPEATETLGFDFHAREGDYRAFTRARLHPADGRAVVERRVRGGPPKTRTYEVGPINHDVASAIFYLRTRPLEPGDREKVGVFTGSNAWHLVAEVEGRETLKTPLGRRPVVRVRLGTHFRGKLAAKREILLWMTDDPAHVPVRIEAELAVGSVQADLASYLPGLE